MPTCRSRVEDVRAQELRQKLRTAVLGAVNTTVVMIGPALSECSKGSLLSRARSLNPRPQSRC